MKYVSTRGGSEPKGFEDVILTGLAPDGGLFVPDAIPQFSQDEIASWEKILDPLFSELILSFIAINSALLAGALSIA